MTLKIAWVLMMLYPNTPAMTVFFIDGPACESARTLLVRANPLYRNSFCKSGAVLPWGVK